MNYKIYNKKDDEIYYKTFPNYKDCYDWIINHLDLSKKLVNETKHISLNLYNGDYKNEN